MKITIIGTGYVGVITAAVLASLGHEVWGLDVDKSKISQLKQGISPIYEKGLNTLLQNGLKSGKLKFTTSYQQSIATSKAVFICVGTPPKPDGSYDPKYVLAAAKDTARNLNGYTVVVIKSTVPPSITAKVDQLMRKYTKQKFDLASVPEFLREGSAVDDAFHPARIVIGTDTAKAKQVLVKIHRKIKTQIIHCDIKSAQLVKYAANAFLATKISFINSLAIIADKIGADIDQVVKGFGSDPRIGKSFLQAGLGYGGSCFPKDTHALIAYSQKLGYNFSFLKQVDRINDKQIDYFIRKIKKTLKAKLKGKTIAVLGLSFKPGTDDMRESRSTLLIKQLLLHEVKVRVYDRVAMANARALLSPQVYYARDIYDCVQGADVLCLATGWPQFKRANFDKIKKLMKGKIVADGRNFLDKIKLKKMGFTYIGIGRA